VPPLAVALVLVSACVHASWNLLAKRTGEAQLILWCAAAGFSLAYLPVGLWLALSRPVPLLGWEIAALSGLLEATYVWTLARAYRHGDLSLVYPIARGTAPLVVPLLAALALGERLSLAAGLGVALVVVGGVTLHLPKPGLAGLRALARGARGPGTRWAVVTGLLIASYSTLDKRGVALVPPLLYVHVLFIGISVVLAPLMLPRREALATAWRQQRGIILLVTVLQPLGYGLILGALTIAPVSHVAAAREISVVIAAVLGAMVLGEPYGPQRVLGSALIAAGLALLVLG